MARQLFPRAGTAGGLRGAVAFALILIINRQIIRQREMFVTTIIAVVYFTVFLQGQFNFIVVQGVRFFFLLLFSVVFLLFRLFAVG